MGQSSYNATKRKKELMLHSLEANFGNVWKASKLIKIATSTHYRWMKEDSDYENAVENMRDISFRNIKDHLLDAAMKQVDKGNVQVLNRLIGVFFKNTPEEMKIVSKNNNLKVRASIKWVSTPQDPRMPGYVKPTEQGRGGG